MNNEIIELFVDVTKTYLSIDIVETENNSEILAILLVGNSLELSGLPLDKLTL